MTVAIPCASCSREISFGLRACPACGRSLSSDERDALESRFEATHVDYRDAKIAVFRGLAAALVAGLLTIAFASLRLYLAADSESGFTSASARSAITDLVAGLVLTASWFGRTRIPISALGVAVLIWSASLVLPFMASPAETILRIASPGGLALTLGRLAVLLILVRGVTASFQMRRLRASAREPG